jgi:uncharacterized protein (TIGR02284 family)
VHDSIEGYRAAVEKAENPRLAEIFAIRLAKREETFERLNTALTDLGEEPVESGSALGTLHELWSWVTAGFDDGDEAIADRVEEGEDYLKERIEEALEDDDLSPPEREALAMALEEVARGEFFAGQLLADLDA